MQLRAGVIFRADVAGKGCIEFEHGRHFEDVFRAGTVPGRTEAGDRGEITVLSAVYPTSDEKIARREHLPGLAIVAVETEYLRRIREMVYALFFLPHVIDCTQELDPRRTIGMVLHGKGEVDENDPLTGSPCVPSTSFRHYLFLDPAAAAALIRMVRGPGGQRPTALINIGCFSSTRHQDDDTTFNEALAALLAKHDITLYGPPHGGVVFSASWFGTWKNRFTQHLEDERMIHEVSVKFQRITPAKHIAPSQRQRAETADKPVFHGTVVITNDYLLAGELGSFSADFSGHGSQTFERSELE